MLIAQPTNSGYESLYDLGDLPRLYLLKSLPPSKEEMAAFGRRHSELARAHEQISARAMTSPYNPNSVMIRTKDDVVVAKYLTDALVAVRQHKFDQVDALIERAKGISPNYAEIYRVEGWYQYFSRNFAAARNAYETAIELQPRSPSIRYWYAGFLLRAQRDTEAAVKQLAVARELDPGSAEIRVEYAKGLAFLFRFDEADDELRPVIEGGTHAIEGGTHATKLMRVAYDGWIQIAVRRANFAIGNNDYLSALNAFQDAVERFDNIPGKYRDKRIIDSIRYCIPAAARVMDELFHSDRAESAKKLVARLEAIGNGIAADIILRDSEPTSIGDQMFGIVDRVFSERSFGFIYSDDNREIFFHRSELKAQVQHMSRLLPGTRVSFVLGKNDKGFIATSIERSPNTSQVTIGAGQRATGRVARRRPGMTYAFVDIGADRDILIRSQDFREHSEWDSVVDGDVVSFVVALGKKEGYIGIDIVLEHKFDRL